MTSVSMSELFPKPVAVTLIAVLNIILVGKVVRLKMMT